MTSKTRTAMAVLAVVALGYIASSCVPPSCPDPDDFGDGGDDDDDDDDKPFPDWDRLEERNEDNCLTENDECEGYPDSDDYGFAKGQTLKNWLLFDCEGNEREFAELFGERPDNELYNKGILIALGATWCGPCKKESEHLAEIADEYREQQIEFVHVLHEGAVGSPATMEVCAAWDEDVSSGKYPIWVDPENEIDEALKANKFDGIPYTVLVDANATVRVRQPPPEFPEDQLDAALESLIKNPYGN